MKLWPLIRKLTTPKKHQQFEFNIWVIRLWFCLHGLSTPSKNMTATLNCFFKQKYKLLNVLMTLHLTQTKPSVFSKNLHMGA